MPSLEPFWIVTPASALEKLEPTPICPLLARPMNRLVEPLVSIVPPTTLPAEPSVMTTPLVPLALTVTGLTTAVPPASCPTRTYELRAAAIPVRALELTRLFVMTSDDVFTADAPFPAFPVIVQLSTTRLLSYDAMRPVLVVFVTRQFLTSTFAPRVATIPKVPPLTVKPGVPLMTRPSMTTRREPSNRIVDWFGSAGMIVAGVTPSVVMLTSSALPTTFSVHVPLMMSATREAMSLCGIVWPCAQSPNLR